MNTVFFSVKTIRVYSCCKGVNIFYIYLNARLGGSPLSIIFLGGGGG